MGKNILITGANVGLGFETARQVTLDERFDRVFLGVRTPEKAQAAIAALSEQTGAGAARYGVALMDLCLPQSVEAAIDQLAADGVTLDALVLNAGGMGRVEQGLPKRTAEGFTELFAMNLAGHARLVEGLLARGVLAADAAVVFSGSEATRGVKAMRMKAPTLPTDQGDLDATLAAVARGDHAGPGYDPMMDYGLIKLIGTAWIRHLAETRPGLRALTVSPGMTTGTEVARNLPGPMKVLMRFVMMPMMSLFGTAHGVETGAARYVQGLTDTSLDNGGFYASPGLTVSGDLVSQPARLQPLLDDRAFIAAAGRLLAPARPAPRLQAVS